MNKRRKLHLVIALSLCFTLTGCGETDYSTNATLKLQKEFAESMQEKVNKRSELQLELDFDEADSLEQNAEGESRDNLDNWIGKYAFDEVYNEEGYAPMFMKYDIDIYKENNQYYADVVVNGHMTGISLKAKLYGNDEWISLVIEEYDPEHVTGLSNMENTVLLSLGRQGKDIYTYWGVLNTLDENLPCSGIYFEKVTEKPFDQAENFGERNELEEWIGRYTFSEESGKQTEELRNYDITIYEKDRQYYADLSISGKDIGVDVKTQIYGNDEWISLVLTGYNPGHESGLEEMKNGVLLSLRKQGEDIYTYWGGWDVTKLLNDDDYFTYYDSVHFFEKIVDNSIQGTIMSGDFSCLEDTDWERMQKSYKREIDLYEWRRLDLNGDCIEDLILQEKRTSTGDEDSNQHRILGIFGCEEDGARCVLWDDVEMGNYSFCGPTGELMNSYYSFGTMVDTEGFTHYYYDKDWNEIIDYRLVIWKVDSPEGYDYPTEWFEAHPDMQEEGIYYRKYEGDYTGEAVLTLEEFKEIYETEMGMEVDSDLLHRYVR